MIITRNSYIGRSLLTVGFLCAAAIGGQYRIRTTAPVTLALPDVKPDAQHFLRGPNLKWRRITPATAEGTATFSITPEDIGEGGDLILLTDKPDWMVLDDAAPPEITAVHIGEKAVPVVDGLVDLGTVSRTQFTLDVACRDQDNPIDGKAITTSFTSDGIEADVQPGDFASLSKAGHLRIVVTVHKPGNYEGSIRVPDRSPRGHAAVLRLSCRRIGISISENRQHVRLATPVGTFEFQPERDRQLGLPNGLWAKLTSNVDGTWLYPREFSDLSAVEDLPNGQRIRVTATTQDIEGAPVEGLGRLEYIFTIRDDIPALLVQTRSVSLTDTPKATAANWGWLPGEYYVTPEGRKEWRGKATNSYKAVGSVGWLWLAPTSPKTSGVAWVSPQRFGESRFDTMLLYADDRDCKRDEAVTIQYAIAPAESAADAAALAERVAEKDIFGR